MDEIISEDLWQTFSHLESYDEAAKEQLAAGFPIYYSDAMTPSDAAIKEFPDGRRELVRFGDNSDVVVAQL